ncbi:MAG: hypothetical protein KatS3mg057_1180 [Herpetosiphonaceae bacterium]|nr:MAG: hypothetical protein KatS3mg057_1180 [Herpetosiphonaceae bacterium]
MSMEQSTPATPMSEARVQRRLFASILVVDDEPDVCEYCTRVLQSDNYRVVATTCTAEALDLIRQRTFDLLLCDIRMPEMNGFELIRQARAIDPTLAVIIMTGFPSLETLLEVVQQGVTSYVGKPFEPGALRLVVAQVLHQRTLLKENSRLEALLHVLDLVKSLNRLLPVDALCEEVIRATNREVGGRCGFVLLTPPDSELRLLHVGEHEGWLSEAGWELLHRAMAEDRVVQVDGACCGAEPGVKNIALPLRAYGEMIGALLLAGLPVDELPFSTIEMTALLATHAAGALRNAQLYEMLQGALDRIKEVDRLKSEFISIASHELRTPLAIVLGYITMMLREPVSERQRDHLRRVLDSAMRINDIVDDMINLRHVETGEAQLNLASCSLHQLLHECATAIEPLAQAKQQELVVELVGDKDCVIAVDQEKIALVLGNLLSNAVKFTPFGGRITVRGWCGRLPAEWPPEWSLDIPLAPGRWIYMSVSDTGIGIAREHQARIFERFYQIEDSLTREHGGAGLGLAIVRGLVELHGGNVYVRSQPGQGSTFIITVPFRMPQQEE